jgi:molybdenum cofactor guanylyltransferase
VRKQTTIAVLAGGRSRRMGTDKSFVLLNGKPLIEHVIDCVSVLSLPVILIANQPEKYAYLGLPTFVDVVPDKGSMGGLFTALTHSRTDYILCVACDMPFLHPPLLECIIDLSGGYDATVPVIEGKPQMLHAIYHRACRGPMHASILAGALKIQSLLCRFRTRFILETGFPPAVFKHDSFVNLNTPQQLAAHLPVEVVRAVTLGMSNEGPQA